MAKDARSTMLGPTWAMAQLTLRQASRGLWLPAIAVLLVGLTAALPHLVLFAFGEEQRIASELGLATMRLAALLVGLGVTVTVARDHTRGTVLTLRPRPLGPLAYAVGRWAGGLLAACALVTMLSVTQALTLNGGGASSSGRWAGAAGVGLEAAVVLALAVLFGHALRPAAAAVATYTAFCVGHLHGHLLEALQHATTAARHLAAPIGLVVPDLSAIGGADRALGAVDLPASLGLAFPPIVAYLSLAAALATWREVTTPRERG